MNSIDSKAREAKAWAVLNEEGDVSMTFPDRAEALTYCGEGEQPVPLVFGGAWKSAYSSHIQRIEQPYTLAELREKIDSNEYSPELLLQHAMRLLGASQQAAEGWRPISEAPESMDRQVVVFWLDSDGNEQTQFDYTEDGCWMEWHNHAEHVEIIGGHGVSYTPPYTHWMPLPAPPSTQGGGHADQA